MLISGMHDLEECGKEMQAALRALGHSTARENHAHAIQSIRRAYWFIRPHTRQPDDQQPFGHLGSKHLNHKNWEQKRWEAFNLLQVALTEIQEIQSLEPGSCNELAHLLYRAYESL